MKTRWIAGGAAGNLTVTGIKTTDKLLYVGGFSLVEGTPNTFSMKNDLTAEFTITAADTINNTGGTSSAAGVLMVQWVTNDAGMG